LSKNNLLNLFSYGYLLIPFLIFTFGWLRLPISLLVLAVFIYLAWRNRSTFPGRFQASVLIKPAAVITIVLLGIWVGLSGIGGYAFQNLDFPIRNAIFRNLIQYHWPLIYPADPNNPLRALVYYIGFWLPAALLGKLAGWDIAQLFLFLWSWLGVFLVVAQLRLRLGSSLLAAALLLIFFSGMDALGVLYMRYVIPNSYPNLWPPVQHLEGWVPGIQFSSFTTELFWVFNQAVPAWLCMALFMNTTHKRQLFLIWSCCFFFAPLPSLGMIPLVAYRMLQRSPGSSIVYKNGLAGKLKSVICNLAANLSPENILGGGTIAVITLSYFAINNNAGHFTIKMPPPILLLFYIIFILVEGGLLWLFLFPEHRKDILFYIVGILLVIFPFISSGGSEDLTRRGSIPILFCLMVWAAESLLRKRNIFNLAIWICLLIGALTPLYEINRSIYRTTGYYIEAVTHHQILDLTPPPQAPGFIPFEDIHPNTLAADDIKTLSTLKPPDSLFFMAEPGSSFFFQYLANSAGAPAPVSKP
jgi:hypothetical protein